MLLIFVYSFVVCRPTDNEFTWRCVGINERSKGHAWVACKPRVAWQKYPSLRLPAHYFDETNRLDEASVRNNPNIVAAEYLPFDRVLLQDIYGRYTFNQTVTVYLGINYVIAEIPDISETFYPASAIVFVALGKID